MGLARAPEARALRRSAWPAPGARARGGSPCCSWSAPRASRSALFPATCRSSASEPTASRSSSARSSSRAPAPSSSSRSPTRLRPPTIGRGPSVRPRGSPGGSTGSRPRSSSSAPSSSTSARSGRCWTDSDAGPDELLVWRPDALGSVCFLVASWLAFAEAGHGWLSWRPHDLGWTIAALNLGGSIFFGLSAIGAYVVPSTGELLSATLANGGTFLGAIGFLSAPRS